MFKFLFNKLDSIWEWLKSFYRFLLPIRASLVSLFFLYFFFAINEQGEDVLRTLSESKSGEMWLQTTLFFMFMFLFALYVWFFARLMLNFKFETINNKTFFLEDTFRKYLPRVIGVAVFFIIFNSLLQVRYSWGLKVTTVVLAIIFYLIVHFRVSVTNKLLKRAPRKNEYKLELPSLKSLPKWSKLTILVNVFLAIGLFLLFTYSIKATTAFGSAAIILSATTCWVGVGALLIYFGLKKTFPIFTLLFILAIIFSQYNNNHTIRDIATTKYKNRLTLTEAFKQKVQELNATKPTPYFIITADGGGIRAAYWTAMVLSALNNKNSNFAKHIFAISSVSGGSLGAAIFTSLLKDKIKCNSKDAKEFGNMASCSDLILQQDFLSYPTAYMLYPDLVQRFLPKPIIGFDRGRALEQGWEIGYKNITNKNTLGENFFNTFKIDSPNLFFNSTWVEGGNRVIMSNIDINKSIFADSIDFFRLFKKDSFLSSMVHNSARFSYVSPAGDLKVNSKSWGHIVDGGYFENSGATTAIDILNTINNKPVKNLVPVVIALTNDPSLKRKCNEYKSGDCHKSLDILNELLSPIRALSKSRGARGVTAKEELKRFVKLKGGIFIEFAIYPIDKNSSKDTKYEDPPLGWSLSRNSRLNMINQLKKQLQSIKNFDPLKLKDLQNISNYLNNNR